MLRKLYLINLRLYCLNGHPVESEWMMKWEETSDYTRSMISFINMPTKYEFISGFNVHGHDLHSCPTAHRNIMEVAKILHAAPLSHITKPLSDVQLQLGSSWPDDPLQFLSLADRRADVGTCRTCRVGTCRVTPHVYWSYNWCQPAGRPAWRGGGLVDHCWRQWPALNKPPCLPLSRPSASGRGPLASRWQQPLHMCYRSRRSADGTESLASRTDSALSLVQGASVATHVTFPSVGSAATPVPGATLWLNAG